VTTPSPSLAEGAADEVFPYVHRQSWRNNSERHQSANSPTLRHDDQGPDLGKRVVPGPARLNQRHANRNRDSEETQLLKECIHPRLVCSVIGAVETLERRGSSNWDQP